GSSSGGMMTQHLLALHPDVFKAGASFMGVPFNCFAGASDYPPGSSRCTGGSMDRTPQQWGDAVRQAYPGYSGPRPRVQLWHGTGDTLVPYSLLRESIEQWTDVFGLSQPPTATDTPQAGWNRSRYANASGTAQVEAYSIQGAGHVLPQSGMARYAIDFFGLTTSQTDTTPPTAPAGLTASGTTATGTTLTWTASTDDTGVTGYDILRAAGTTGGTFTQAGTSPTPSFTDTGLTANTTYRYQVRARDAAGNVSPVSGTIQVTTQPGSTTGACSATATVQTQWGNGYVIQPLTITNTGTSTITTWTVTFTLPAGHTLTGSWNATITTSGQTITARSAAHNGTLAAGASTSFGFQASRPNGNTALPSGYTCA
ncbi:cellulose binding domain-containing protein, partial [Nonomuraea monospora]|uniref:cellulose binding domain-containing protein n=1 Tax=Nonomuraea monospora TaxID=568818 RepID=UPI0031D04FB8